MLVTLLFAFFSLIALMIVHEFGHFIIAKKFGVKVEEFGIGYPPRIFGKKFGETLYSINLIPIGAFVKIYGEEGGIDDLRSFSNLAIYKRMLIVLGGVIAFWVAAIIIFSIMFGIGAALPVGDQDVTDATPTHVAVMAVSKNSPADLAGLKTKDVIISLKISNDTLEINKVRDFQYFIKENQGKLVTVTVNRNGQNLAFNMTPRVSYLANEGSLGVEIMRLATIIQKYPWYEAPMHGILFTGEVTLKSLQGIYGVITNLFSGKGVPQGAELAGPIGITLLLAQVANYGLGPFLFFVGSISVLVAIFNLFPVPALDGGKMVFLIIEKVMKKPVPAKWEQIITVTFFVLLILMSLFVTIKFDIPRLIDYVSAAFKH